MTGSFGEAPVRLVHGSGTTPQQDMELSTAARRLRRPDVGRLRVHTPRPTAAFSRLDSLAAGFAAAEEAAEHGFAPGDPARGGRLAAYGDGALVLDLVAPHPEPRVGHRQRFAAAAACVSWTACATRASARCPGSTAR